MPDSVHYMPLPRRRDPLYLSDEARGPSPRADTRGASRGMERVPENILNIWQNIVTIVAETCGVDVCLITRFDPPEEECVNVSGSAAGRFAPGERWSMSGSFAGTVFESKSRLLVGDAARDGRWERCSGVRGGMVSYLGYPLFHGDGRVFGTICVLDSAVIRSGNRFDAIMKECKSMIEEHLRMMVPYDLAAVRGEVVRNR